MSIRRYNYEDRPVNLHHYGGENSILSKIRDQNTRFNYRINIEECRVTLMCTAAYGLVIRSQYIIISDSSIWNSSIRGGR